jgi:type VI secretion system secreted protein VgrG
MPGKPAARVTDLTTHGSPLSPGPGSPDTLIGSLPAWRTIVDQHACPAASISGADGVGFVIVGSPTVWINNQMACRIQDIVVEKPGSAMGPVNPIAMGCPTVLIGEVGVGVVAGLPVAQLPNGTIAVGTSISITGDPTFMAKTLNALAAIGQLPSGNQLLNAIEANGKDITIEQTTRGNTCGYPPATAADRFVKPDGTPGGGTDAVVRFNPDNVTIGTEPWETRPPAIGLGHELVHAEHATRGGMKRGDADNDSRPDPANPGGFAQAPVRELEATGIPPHDEEPVNENKLREEWQPQQPARQWY